MNKIIRKFMSLRKDNKINGGEEMVLTKKENMESNTSIKREINQGGGIVLPTRKINTVEKKIMERKKIQERENSKKEFTGKFAKQISGGDMQSIFQHSGTHIGKSEIQMNQRFPVPTLGVSNTNKLDKNELYGQLQNKIIGQGNNIALTKGVVPDPRKRQFIKTGILGIIAGIGIAVFSKMTRGVQFINFPNNSSNSTTAFNLQSSGSGVTMPLQPCVLAKKDNRTNDQTGDGTAYTIPFETERFDQNSDWDGTSTFTAPVTGRYWVSFGVHIRQAATDMTVGFMQVVASNRTIQNNSAQASGVDGTGMFWGTLVDMDASDTVTVVIGLSNGSKVADIDASTDDRTSISIHLVA